MSAMSSAALLASSVSSAADAEQKPMRCGFLGINHAHALDALGIVRGLPEYEVVGICEPDASVREAVEGHRKVEGLAWLSVEELLGDETVQMVASMG